jgi:dephospho-CoA kinase
VLLVGLTGGIGSGKSEVARMLAARGAVVRDADDLARDAVEPDTPGHRAIVARFGPGVLAEDGTIDRAELASLVFADPAARRDLEAIVHPEVRRRFEAVVREHLGSERVVVLDSPLLVETGRYRDFDTVVLVAAPVETQVARLIQERGMREEDVRARIAAQLPLEEKARVAEFILDNGGTLAELEAQVDRLWPELERRARTGR